MAAFYYQSTGNIGKSSWLIYGDSFIALPLCIYILPCFWRMNGVWLAMPVSRILLLGLLLYFWLGIKENKTQNGGKIIPAVRQWNLICWNKCEVIMLLLKEKLTLTSSFLQAAKNLYLTAFPENERLPWWYLFLSSFRKGICFYAIHCESKFCGILYTVSGNEALLIVYVAVAPELRSQGAGGKFIDLIKQQYPDRSVYLLMESCDGINDPADMRIRRQRFYFRNGFSDTLWRYNSDDVRYDLLCNNEKFNIAEYKRLMNKLLIFYPKGEYFKID